MTTADGITRIVDLVDGYWGLRLRHKELAHASGWCRVLVYDAFTVRLSIVGDAVRIEVHATAPEPAELQPLDITHDLVPSAPLRLDEEIRSRLPDST